MKVSDSTPVEQEALSFFKDKGNIEFTIHEFNSEYNTDENLEKEKSFLNYDINHEQYLRVLRVRQILSILMIVLALSWILQIVLKATISFSEDSVRIVTISFIGMIVPALMATRIYDFLYFSKQELDQE